MATALRITPWGCFCYLIHPLAVGESDEGLSPLIYFIKYILRTELTQWMYFI